MGIWSIRQDGSGLQPLSDVTDQVFFPIWSPDQQRIAAVTETQCVIFNVSEKLPAKTFQPLPNVENANVFQPNSWSPDGKWLAGDVRRPDASLVNGVLVYSFDSGKYEKLVDAEPGRGGNNAIWLADSRTLLYTDKVSSNRYEIFMIDRISKKSTKIYSPPPSVIIDALATSKDNRSIFYIRPNPQADVWMMTMK